jgi:stringent starvation protein B
VGALVGAALATDAARVAIALRAPHAVVFALLQAKAGVLMPVEVADGDRVVLQVAPSAYNVGDDLVEVVERRVTELGERTAAVILSPVCWVRAVMTASWVKGAGTD